MSPRVADFVRGNGAAVIISLVLLAAALGCSGEQSQPAVSWQPIHRGLESHAPILALAVDPADPQTLYAGAYHTPGLYKSTDGGERWQVKDRGLEGQVVYSLLALPESAPGSAAVFAGALEGLYRSTDGGEQWQRVDGLPDATIYALAADGRGRLYCGTDGHGLFRSDDGGRSFDSIPLVGPPTNPVILSLAASADGDVILVGTDGWGVFGSWDGGRTWRRGLETAFVSEVALDPHRKQVAYVRTRKGLYRTEDGGRRWAFSSEGIEGRIDSLAVDPQRPGVIYAGVSGSGVYRSDDGGRSWRRTGPGFRPWVAIFALAIAPGPRPVLYAGAWDGVYRSDDEGARWRRINQGLGDVHVHAVALDPDDPRIIYAADIDGVHRSTDGGRTWELLDLGPEQKGYLSLAPGGRGLLYAGAGGRGVARSDDGGRTWRMMPDSPQVAIPGLAVDTSDPRRLLARAAYERVYESKDGGETWRARWEGFDLHTEIIAVAISPHDPRVAYAGADDGLYVSRDGCESWQRIGDVLNRQTVYCFLFDPADPQRLYVGATEGIYRSDDGGLTWQRWGRGLEGITVTTLAFDPADDDTVYAGTKYHGLYRSDDGGRIWHPIGPEGLSINGLAIHPAGRPLYVATPRGLFKSANQGVSGSADQRSAAHNTQQTRNMQHTIRHSPFAVRHSPACGIHTLRPDAKALAAVRATGCRWVVQLFDWREIEYGRDRWNWEFPDAVVRGAEYHGLRVVARLDQCPTWATSEGQGHCPSDLLAEYGDFVEAVARRYRGRIVGYIIWNEPNLAREWGGKRPDPAAYVALLKEAYTRIKAADPGALVISAGLAPTNDVGDRAVDDRIFLRGMYEAGAKEYFDVLGGHPYGFAYPPDDPAGAHEGFNFARLADLRQIMVEYGDGDKPVWATEMGWTTEAHGERAWQQVTPEEQADYLVAAFEKARREWPWLEMMAVWNLGDGLKGSEGEEEKWGYRLLDPDGSPRPAYQALAAMPKGWTFPSPAELGQRLRQTLDAWLGRQRVEVLADDVVIHLGDNEFDWPWVPLHQGPGRQPVWGDQFRRWEREKTHFWKVAPVPSVVWRGQFYVRDPGRRDWKLHLELMQNNERGNYLTVNGHRVEPRTFPVEDFTRCWVALSFVVPARYLRPGPNEVAISLSRQIPDYRQIGVWDDLQFKDIWLMQTP